jgi:hypothetical protein
MEYKGIVGLWMGARLAELRAFKKDMGNKSQRRSDNPEKDE